MISKEQVADLRAGDVVEVTHEYWPAGSVVRGPLTASDWGDLGLYLLDGDVGVRDWQGNPYDPRGTLTVVSRAPRPLYVNHDRTEPVSGDVVRQDGGPFDSSPHTWHYLKREDGVGRWWRFDDTSVPFDQDKPLRLLVDGETGRCVP